MNYLTNFLIKTIIEKVISDLFKADDLKGPIFDYYLNDDFEFVLWNTTYENLPLPPIEKNKIFYYNNYFIYTYENLPYQLILRKLIKGRIPLFILGKNSSGKTSLINYILNEFEKSNEIKKIVINNTFNKDSKYFENYINQNLDILKRKNLGNVYSKNSLIFIDDVHINKNVVQIQEYIRKFLSTKCMYNNKNNQINYYIDVNMINIGNYCEEIIEDKTIFERYLVNFSLITLNFILNNYISIFKPIVEFHFRNYIPNTSNITANQYIQVLFKLVEILQNNILFNFKNMHYSFDILDISNILQKFNLFLYKGTNTNEYQLYIKKLFFYETYTHFSNKINDKNDLNILMEKICQTYSSIFKQDKTDIDFYDKINDNSFYMFGKNFIDIYNENPEKNYIPENELEYVYIDKRMDMDLYIEDKLSKFYKDSYLSNGGKNSESSNYIINKYNKEYIYYILHIMHLLENVKKNILLIGNKDMGKEVLIKISLYIFGYTYIQIDLNSLIKKGKENFEKKFLVDCIQNAVYNNRKIFLIFNQELFDNYNLSEEYQIYLLEIIVILLNPNEILDKINFINETLFGKQPIEELLEKLKNNLFIVLNIQPNTYIYEMIFTKYTYIIKNINVYYIKKIKDNLLLQNHNLFLNTNKDISMDKNLNTLIMDIYNYVKNLYEEFSDKIYIDIKICNRHYMHFLEFINLYYKKYKEILISKNKNYEIISKSKNKSSELISNLEFNINKLLPDKLKNEKLIEDNKKIINELNGNRNLLKMKRSDNEKPLNLVIKELNAKKLELNNILQPFHDKIKKYTTLLNKVKENDIMEIKNTWENFNFGKFLLNKVFEISNDKNYQDYDYIKKNLEPKIFKNLSKLDYSNSPTYLVKIIKDILNNSDYQSGDKFNKPYKLAGTLCDFAKYLNRYFENYFKQSDILLAIENLQKQIEQYNEIINDYNIQIKEIEGKILNLEDENGKIETQKNYFVSQINKYSSLNKEIKSFLENLEQNKNIFEDNKNSNDILLKYFDYYFIYIASFIIYAPLLNKSYREKLTNYIYLNCKEIIENNKNNLNGNDDHIEFKKISFVNLIYNFLDINEKDNELCSSIDKFNDFLKENFIFLNFNVNKIAFIIDYTQSSKKIISSYLQFIKPKNIQNIEFDLNSSEFKEKLDYSFKNGANLFIENAKEINEIYYYFFNLINDKTKIEEKSKKIVTIDEIKYSYKFDNFKLFILKNNINNEKKMKIDSDIYFNMIIINFNISKDDIKQLLLNEITESQEEKLFKLNKNISNDLIKDKFKKLILENKIIKSIINFDLSGNLDKLSNIQSLNEKFLEDCLIHTNCLNNIKNKQRKLEIIKSILDEKFLKFINDSSIIYKWLYKFFIVDNNFILNFEFLFDIFNQFLINENNKIIEKNKKLNNNNKNINLTSNEENEEETERINMISSIENEDENNNLNSEEDEETNYIKNNINKKNEFIYDKNSIKKFILFIYSKIYSIFVSNLNHTIHINLLLAFLFLNLYLNDEISKDFKKILFLTFYYTNNNDDYNENNEENNKSPIKSIKNEDWIILNKINKINNLFENTFNDIKNNSNLWEEYLSDDKNIINNSKVNYFYNNFEFPEEEIENKSNAFSKFIFFYILKPFKSEKLINYLIEHYLFNENEILNEYNISNKFKFNFYKNNDIIKSFQNFDFKNNFAIILKHNNLNYYDKIIFNYCFLNLITQDNEKPEGEKSDREKNNNNNINNNNLKEEKENYLNNEIKFKEIQLINKDISKNDIDYIKSILKTGGVIYIKKLNIIKNSLDELIEIYKNQNEKETSNNFKLIFVIKENELILNQNIYKNTLIINNNFENENNLKNLIIQYVLQIPKIYYDFILNFSNNNSLKIYLRKLEFNYIILFSVLIYKKYKFNFKDFLNLNNHIYKFIKNFDSEEKINSFLNIENNIGFNYWNFIQFINNSYIKNKIYDKNSMIFINNLIDNFFTLDKINNNEYYFASEYIQFTISKEENNDDILNFEKFYNIFDFYSNEEYENLLLFNQEQKNNNQINYIQNIMNNFIILLKGKNNTNYLKNNQNDNLNNIQNNKLINSQFNIINNNLNILRSKFQEKIYYIFNTDNMNDEKNENINQFLFKVNKNNMYNNPLDESLLNEIKFYNNYLDLFQNEINKLINIITNKMNYNEKYKEIFIKLFNDEIPNNLNFINNQHEKIKLKEFETLLSKRINFIKNWIKNGNILNYNLSYFTNKKLFFNFLKMKFCRKYYEDNFFSKITPDMIKLNFIYTKYKNFDELEKDVEGKKNLLETNNNEIIFIDGMYIKNANIDYENYIIDISENQKNKINKMNIVGVTYNLIHYKIIKDEDSEEEESEENEEEKNENTNNENNIEKEDNNNIKKEHEIKINIIDKNINDEDDNVLGSFEYKCKNIININEINEKNIIIFFDDYYELENNNNENKIKENKIN